MDKETIQSHLDLTSLPAILDQSEAIISTLPFSSAELKKLRLILEELLVNITTHGYKGTGPIELHFTLKPSIGIEIELIDQAPPFNPLEVPPPTLDTPGGLGVHLVREFTDSISYSRHGSKNHLRFSKSLKN